MKKYRCQGNVFIRLGLSQLAVEDKTNEIGAMPEFLVGLILEGQVLTTDALLTQRKVARTIVSSTIKSRPSTQDIDGLRNAHFAPALR